MAIENNICPRCDLAVMSGSPLTCGWCAYEDRPVPWEERVGYGQAPTEFNPHKPVGVEWGWHAFVDGAGSGWAPTQTEALKLLRGKLAEQDQQQRVKRAEQKAVGRGQVEALLSRCRCGVGYLRPMHGPDSSIRVCDACGNQRNGLAPTPPTFAVGDRVVTTAGPHKDEPATVTAIRESSTVHIEYDSGRRDGMHRQWLRHLTAEEQSGCEAAVVAMNAPVSEASVARLANLATEEQDGVTFGEPAGPVKTDDLVDASTGLQTHHETDPDTDMTTSVVYRVLQGKIEILSATQEQSTFPSSYIRTSGVEQEPKPERDMFKPGSRVVMTKRPYRGEAGAVVEQQWDSRDGFQWRVRLDCQGGTDGPVTCGSCDMQHEQPAPPRYEVRQRVEVRTPSGSACVYVGGLNKVGPAASKLP